MSEDNMMLALSVLYRSAQKYYDHALGPYKIGSGQLVYLFYINEHEGCSMQEVTRIGEVDKGTTSKSVQKLRDEGYVDVRQDPSDKRVKRLYTTEAAAGIMNALYAYRNDFRKRVYAGIDTERLARDLYQACENARSINPEEPLHDLKIGGLQKTTLLDYPGLVACTIFTAGCNFKCPFCHNKDLVFVPENYEYFDVNDVFAFLAKRRGILDGVCISGGEPLIHGDLLPFIQRIKDLGFKVKLDTNGYAPEKLKEAVETGLIDYVAMDVKNSRASYAKTCGLNAETFHLERIEESIDYLKEGHVDYEFRTTVVKELHSPEDLKEIGYWLKGAKRYYLQQFNDSGSLIQEGFHAYDKEDMEKLLDMVKENIPAAELRGVKGE